MKFHLIEDICITSELLGILKMSHQRNREQQDEEKGYKMSETHKHCDLQSWVSKEKILYMKSHHYRG